MYHRQLGPHRSIMRHRRVFSVAAFCLFRQFNEIAMSRYNLTDFEWNMIKPLLPTSQGVCRVLTGSIRCSYGEVDWTLGNRLRFRALQPLGLHSDFGCP